VSEEIPFEDGLEEALSPVAKPEVVQAQVVQPAKRRGRPPKAKPAVEPVVQEESQPEPEQSPKKIIVCTRYPYALHCSSQNILIPADTPTEVEPDYWIQSQIDAGLLKVL
jgi:hypothetical protein